MSSHSTTSCRNFDPLLPCGEIFPRCTAPPPIAAHCAEVAAAGGLVVIHPTVGMPPAILKGCSTGSCGRASHTGFYRGMAGRAFRWVPKAERRSSSTLQHPGRGTGGLRRSARTALEGLHLYVLRDPGVHPDVLCDGPSTDEQRRSWLDEGADADPRGIPPDPA
jgi:hypothetical protein